MPRPLPLAAILPTLGVVLTLAGCGGTAPRPADSPTSVEPTQKSAPRASTRKSTVVQKRGGAYYKDDGPGDDIPDNLDELPDAEPRDEPLHRFANRPYVVFGKNYTPKTAVAAFNQKGIGSWYGKKFHGQKTSTGEAYDMFAMTAAHPTLPLPSYVRVTNVSNGRSVVVRVNDRGPFHADRVIDLSYAAAYRLGYVDNGSAQVEVVQIIPSDATNIAFAQVAPPLRNAPVNDAAPRLTQPSGRPPASTTPMQAEALDPIAALAARLESRPESRTESRPDPRPEPRSDSSTNIKSADAAPSPQRGLFLQLGAFSSADNADSFRNHLARELDWLSEPISIAAGGGMHRVHLGPYENRSAAEKVAERIRQAVGYKPTFVTR